MSEEKPRLGDDILFYPPGHTEPLPAKVQAVWNGDLVTLLVWEVNRYVEKRSVNRRGSKTLVNTPTIEMVTGSWDYRDPPDVRKAMKDMLESFMASTKAKTPAKV